VREPRRGPHLAGLVTPAVFFRPLALTHPGVDQACATAEPFGRERPPGWARLRWA
jgi:hypothetical protein